MTTDEAWLDHEPWTEEGARRLQFEAGALSAAVRAHAERLAAMRDGSELPAIFSAGDELVAAILSYSDRQFRFSGTIYPFGPIKEFSDADA